MWIAENWKDYEVLDTSKGEKLERWGDYTLVRPDPQVIWDTPKTLRGWKRPNAHYHRSKRGGGEWEFFDLPEQWSIHYQKLGLTFQLKPFSFKHTGLFPEQATNWDWFSEKIKKAGRPIKVLNLFAYTGGATLAAAAAGASVTHVDASKGMVTWAKENARSSGLGDAPIRWIVDDCVKFVEREIRRGNHYDRTGSCRPHLHAGNRTCCFSRSCRLPGSRTSCFRQWTCAALWGIRTLGNLIFKDIAGIFAARYTSCIA